MQGNIQKETDKLKEKKLRYCDKTTKFEKKSHFVWRFLSNVKPSGRFFVAFSENLNFISAGSFATPERTWNEKACMKACLVIF